MAVDEEVTILQGNEVFKRKLEGSHGEVAAGKVQVRVKPSDTAHALPEAEVSPTPMSVLCLHCWGLGKVQAVSDLRNLLWRHSPNVVFLSETKRSATEMASIKNQLDDFEGLYMDALDRAGGVAVLWDKSVNFTFLSSSLQSPNGEKGGADKGRGSSYPDLCFEHL